MMDIMMMILRSTDLTLAHDVMQVHTVMIIRHLPVIPLPDLTLGSKPLSHLEYSMTFLVVKMVPQWRTKLVLHWRITSFTMNVSFGSSVKSSLVPHCRTNGRGISDSALILHFPYQHLHNHSHPHHLPPHHH